MEISIEPKRLLMVDNENREDWLENNGAIGERAVKVCEVWWYYPYSGVQMILLWSSV